MKQLKVSIQHRYNEAEAWRRINPILKAGELGIESDTGKFKCGNGRHAWLELEYSAGNGISSTIFDGYDNEKTGSEQEKVGVLTDPQKVFKISAYPASNHPAEIVIVPRLYNKGEENEYIMDTPYISLRKNDKWMWVVFADQKNKALASSALGSFVLGSSPLG